MVFEKTQSVEERFGAIVSKHRLTRSAIKDLADVLFSLGHNIHTGSRTICMKVKSMATYAVRDTYRLKSLSPRTPSSSLSLLIFSSATVAQCLLRDVYVFMLL